MSNPRTGRPWLVAGVVVVLLAVAGVVAYQVLPDEPSADVMIIGDSVSFVSGGSIDRRFTDETVTYVTKPGYTSGDLLPLVYDAMDSYGVPGAPMPAGVLVGYNDVRYGLADGESLAELVEATSSFGCAVWMTLPARPGGEPSTFDGMDPDLIEVWNQRLADETARYDNVHLANDWADVVTRAPAEELLDDGLHPNVAGQRRLAEAYYAALGRNC